jgi:hypothetical protein
MGVCDPTLAVGVPQPISSRSTVLSPTYGTTGVIFNGSAVTFTVEEAFTGQTYAYGLDEVPSDSTGPLVPGTLLYSDVPDPADSVTASSFRLTQPTLVTQPSLYTGTYSSVVSNGDSTPTSRVLVAVTTAVPGVYTLAWQYAGSPLPANALFVPVLQLWSTQRACVCPPPVFSLV